MVSSKTNQNFIFNLPEDSKTSSVRNSQEIGINGSHFVSVRETIYSEVATLISQNENRPDFLIELFRDLQFISTDSLRLRLLENLHSLITKPIKPKEKMARRSRKNKEEYSSECKKKNIPKNLTKVTSELTPSESLTLPEEIEVTSEKCSA